MTVSRLRAVLSLLVVGSFVVVTAVLALAPVVGGYPPEGYSEHLKSYGSLGSGTVGLIVGFFFGKREEKTD